MKQFVLHLQSPSRYERIDGVTSFIGRDESGSFGILPDRERIMTVLSPGIMCFTVAGKKEEYLGLAESLLYFIDNELFISAQKYLRDNNHENLSSALLNKLEKEETELTTIRETIRRMEEALFSQILRTPGARNL